MSSRGKRKVLYREIKELTQDAASKSYLEFLRKEKISDEQITQQLVIFNNYDELMENYDEDEFKD